VYIYIYLYIYIHLYTYTYTYIHIYILTCIFLRIHVYMRVYMHIYLITEKGAPLQSVGDGTRFARNWRHQDGEPTKSASLVHREYSCVGCCGRQGIPREEGPKPNVLIHDKISFGALLTGRAKVDLVRGRFAAVLALFLIMDRCRNHCNNSDGRAGRGREEDSPNCRRSPYTCFAVSDARTTVTRNTGIQARRGFVQGQIDNK